MCLPGALRRAPGRSRGLGHDLSRVMSDVFLYLGAFLANAVEMVEALTIVLAVAALLGRSLQLATKSG